MYTVVVSINDKNKRGEGQCKDLLERGAKVGNRRRFVHAHVM